MILCMVGRLCEHRAMFRDLLLGSLLMPLCVCGAIACTALVEADEDSLGAPPQACAPGEINNCPCTSGTSGRQKCNEGGSFDPCVCGVDSVVTAGTAAPAPNN